MSSRVKSTHVQSEREWRAQGYRMWWCRVGQGRGARFVRLAPGAQQGNVPLDAVVELPVGTVVALGIGDGPAVETVKTQPVRAP